MPHLREAQLELFVSRFEQEVNRIKSDHILFLKLLDAAKLFFTEECDDRRTFE